MNIVIAALAGVLTWSLLEYFIHRFLGHHPKLRPNPFAAEHVRHHSEGDYFAPTYKKVILAVFFLGTVTPLGVWLFGVGPGVAYSLGLVSMYVSYEVLHRRLHTHAGVGFYGRWARRHHFHHHFGNPKMNHGVTSPLFDVVFGTREPVAQVRVPKKLAMEWLCDDSGAVHAQHAGVYSLR
jgi:sterol desaturase/sphingolipid hydroxylase (fatty acid hydroxylase superfamily)